MSGSASGAWPFEDPPNVAVITVRKSFDEGEPILLVSHDEDDAAWRFLPGRVVDVAETTVVSLNNMVDRDPTILELADLPLGWIASRRDVGDPWQREPQS